VQQNKFKIECKKHITSNQQKKCKNHSRLTFVDLKNTWCKATISQITYLTLHIRIVQKSQQKRVLLCTTTPLSYVDQSVLWFFTSCQHRILQLPLAVGTFKLWCGRFFAVHIYTNLYYMYTHSLSFSNQNGTLYFEWAPLLLRDTPSQPVRPNSLSQYSFWAVT